MPTSMNVAGLHLRPMQPEGDLVVAVGLARHRQRQMVEDALVEAVHDGERDERRPGRRAPAIPAPCIPHA